MLNISRFSWAVLATSKGILIGIIDFIGPDKLLKPVYYSCDWDYHGQAIYSRVMQKLTLHNSTINLLLPYTYDTVISVNSPHHNSLWDISKHFSGLKETDFDAVAQSLIKEDKWIDCYFE